LSAATLAPGIIKETETSGFVRRIKSKIVKGNPQFEFLLRDGYVSHEVSLDPDSYDILVTIHNEVFSKKRLELEEGKNRWAFNVVVIDPGHGGKDPGASGVTGTREKDINLKIGLKLGKLIEKNLKDVKVVYTRKTDEFIELYKRGKIANEADGNLFISIHCNSLKKKPSAIKGYEVYLLRPGRTEEAISIAEFENSVIEFEENPDRYQELTDENFILVSMAHSSNMRYSEKFSDLLNNELSAKAKIPSRGIKQAGFYVLVGASMPGILFESGYLSNKEDEKYLKSDKGQQDIAQAMFNSVKSYKKFYDESLIEETL
jgi:N-acetylmuramoyl-L-alanine amidase